VSQPQHVCYEKHEGPPLVEQQSGCGSRGKALVSSFENVGDETVQDAADDDSDQAEDRSAHASRAYLVRGPSRRTTVFASAVVAPLGEHLAWTWSPRSLEANASAPLRWRRLSFFAQSDRGWPAPSHVLVQSGGAGDRA
jgi:hypothetical protein